MANLELGRRVRRVPVFSDVQTITGTVEGIADGKIFVATPYGRSWQPSYMWEPCGAVVRDEIDEPIDTIWGAVASERVPTKPLGGHGR